MSSRNVFLTPQQRAKATLLFSTLNVARLQLEKGVRDAHAVRRLMTKLISAEPLAKLDYLSVADPHTLDELDTIQDAALLSMAVFFGNTRLIDNLLWEL